MPSSRPTRLGSSVTSNIDWSMFATSSASTFGAQTVSIDTDVYQYYYSAYGITKAEMDKHRKEAIATFVSNGRASGVEIYRANDVTYITHEGTLLFRVTGSTIEATKTNIKLLKRELNTLSKLLNIPIKEVRKIEVPSERIRYNYWLLPFKVDDEALFAENEVQEERTPERDYQRQAIEQYEQMLRERFEYVNRAWGVNELDIDF